MADKVLWQDGDDLSEQNLTEVLALENQTDYVVRGLGFSSIGSDTVDIGSGYAVIETANNEAYHVFPDSRSNLSLTSNDVNHVFLEIDETTDDSIDYHIDTADTAPSNPSLKIGTVDTNTDTGTELNRDPSVSADELTVNDITAKLIRTSNQSISASTDTTISWDTRAIDTNLYSYDTNNDTIDVLTEGDYHVSGAVVFDGVSDQDNLIVKLSANGSEIYRFQQPAPTTFGVVPISVTLKNRPANDTLKFDARCATSCNVKGTSTENQTFVTIERGG